MKKIISIVLVLIILVSLSIPVLAHNYKCPNDDSCSAQIFNDINENSWYHLYIDYVYTHKKAIEPISETEFGVNIPVTRGECIYALYTMSDSNVRENVTVYSMHDDEYEFSDIEFGSKIYAACIWGRKNDIINGFEDNSFRPDDLITREQMAAIIYRYNSKFGPLAKKDISIRNFADYKDISDWATEAMWFMVQMEYYQGNDKGELSPKKNITRAEFCTIMYRRFDPWESDNIEVPSLPGH